MAPTFNRWIAKGPRNTNQLFSGLPYASKRDEDLYIEEKKTV
jgi:hypothetical protein